MPYGAQFEALIEFLHRYYLMNFSKLKENNYFWSVILLPLIPLLILHVYFWNNDLLIQETYGKVMGIPGPKNSEALAEFFEPSIFEGEKFGGQDVTFFLVGLVLILYLISFLPGIEQKLSKFRIYFSSIFAYAAFGFVFELSWKCIFARPRPGDVDGGLTFVHAFQVGTVPFDDAYHGSFPSGHTFAAAVLYILVFLALGIKQEKKKKWTVGIGFTLVTIWSALMGAGRVHDHAHYASDNLWAIYFAFMYAYFFYFYIFRVPEQVAAGSIQVDGSKPFAIREKRMWEIHLLFSIIFFEVSVLLVVLGIKELVNIIFSLGLPMLTELLSAEGIMLSGYLVAILMIGLGIILSWMFKNRIQANLKHRPSEIKLVI